MCVCLFVRLSVSLLTSLCSSLLCLLSIFHFLFIYLHTVISSFFPSFRCLSIFHSLSYSFLHPVICLLIHLYVRKLKQGFFGRLFFFPSFLLSFYLYLSIRLFILFIYLFILPLSGAFPVKIMGNFFCVLELDRQADKTDAERGRDTQTPTSRHSERQTDRR